MAKQANSSSYKALLDQAYQQLCDSSDSPRIDAEVLLQHVLNKPLAWLFSHGELVAQDTHVIEFRQLIARRSNGEPVAYIVGHKEFWSLELKVNNHVLVPRADTETLIERSLEFLSSVPSDQPNALDLGTGSGAIALAIAKSFPQATITATDISDAALEIAQENAETHNIKNVCFVQGSWYQALSDVNIKHFDLIVSNPPYVAKGDPHLAIGDLPFEPNMALTAKNNGLGDLIVIVEQAKTHLNIHGMLIVEHGYNQQNEVERLFTSAGFTDIQTHKDLNQLPRCTSGVLS